MMRYAILILLLSVACFAQMEQYGVMSVCTKLDGRDFCYLSPGEYHTVEMDGTMVVALGFTTHRYTAVGEEKSFTNGNGTKVRFWQANDESGNRFLVHKSRDNLLISDTTGCATMKYVTGGPDMFKRLYRFEEVDSIDAQFEIIEKCHTARKESKK